VRLLMGLCTLFPLVLLLAPSLALPSKTTREIAPGVNMPVVNCGGVESKPSNYSAFLALGGRGLDTALTYGPSVQRSVGAALKQSGIKRQDIFVTTKIPCCPQKIVAGMCDAPYNRSVADDVAADLEQLGLEYVDLMLLHWGCNTMEETISIYNQLEKLGLQGKFRALGISNFNSTNMQRLLDSGLTMKPAINQCGYSIGNHNNTGMRDLGRDDETRLACQAAGITYQAYSPLGGLSGINVLGDKDVQAIATAHGVSPAQVALRWVIQQDSIFVTAASNPLYLSEDLDVFGFRLNDTEMGILSSK